MQRRQVVPFAMVREHVQRETKSHMHDHYTGTVRVAVSYETAVQKCVNETRKRCYIRLYATVYGGSTVKDIQRTSLTSLLSSLL